MVSYRTIINYINVNSKYPAADYNNLKDTIKK